jgi:prefoldin subunit 5
MDNEQLRILVTELEQTHHKITTIKQQLGELSAFAQDFPTVPQGAAILTPLGKGVFREATLVSSENCFVEVGAGIVLKKTKAEVEATLAEQQAGLRTAHTSLLHHQASLEQQAQHLLEHNV